MRVPHIHKYWQQIPLQDHSIIYVFISLITILHGSGLMKTHSGYLTIFLWWVLGVLWASSYSIRFLILDFKYFFQYTVTGDRFHVAPGIWFFSVLSLSVIHLYYLFSSIWGLQYVFQCTMNKGGHRHFHLLILRMLSYIIITYTCVTCRIT